MRFIIFSSVLSLVFLSCSGENSKSASEEKASELTRSLLKEMQEQDSIEAMEADTVSIDSIK